MFGQQSQRLESVAFTKGIRILSGLSCCKINGRLHNRVYSNNTFDNSAGSVSGRGQRPGAEMQHQYIAAWNPHSLCGVHCACFPCEMEVLVGCLLMNSSGSKTDSEKTSVKIFCHACCGGQEDVCTKCSLLAPSALSP